MPTLEIEVEWLPRPEGDVAFGPELGTWGGLSLFLDGISLITRPDDRGPENNQVVGGLSGLAEWLVDNWLPILWELHAPFPMNALGIASAGIPTLFDAERMWPELSGVGVDPAKVAAWQHRHTFGHGSSSIALPSIVLLPEEDVIGIQIGRPASGLRPTAALGVPKLPPKGDAVVHWLGKDDFKTAVTEFISSTISRAKADPEGEGWARWLERRWDGFRQQEIDQDTRRRLRLGELVASRWKGYERTLRGRVSVLEGWILDSPLLEKDELIDKLAHQVAEIDIERPILSRRPQIDPPSPIFPPYVQGYYLASQLREHLGNRDKPITDLAKTLEAIGIRVVGCESFGLFRAAATVIDGDAVVLGAKDDEHMSRVAPMRFGVAAAAGRILAESNGQPYGSALGPYSRLLETQRANAFAAELLLPATAIRGGADKDQLSEDYGISRAATSWQVKNRASPEF